MDFYRRTCLNCGHCISNIFPGNTISKMLSRAVSKINEGQGQRSKGTTVIMT